MRNDIIKASVLHFKAHIEKHRVNVENLLRNPVGVAEHPNLVDDCESLIQEIAEAEDGLRVLRNLLVPSQPPQQS